MKIIRLMFLILFAAVSIAAQTALNPGEFLTTQDPNFSLDGKYIVFSSKLNKSSPNRIGGREEISSGLRLMNADGSGMRVVTPNVPGVFDSKATISHDNSKIVFIRQTGNVFKRVIEVYVVNTNGTGLKKITGTAEHEAYPAFTADAKEVVYIRTDPPVNLSSVITGALISYDLQTSTEKLLLGREYKVVQAIPTPRKGAFTIICSTLNPSIKPAPKATGEDSIVTNLLALGVPPILRNLANYKLPPTAKGTISFISMANNKNAFLVAVTPGSVDKEYYLLTGTSSEPLGKFSGVEMNISPDGGKMLAGGDNYEVRAYDIQQKSWAKITGRP